MKVLRIVGAAGSVVAALALTPMASQAVAGPDQSVQSGRCTPAADSGGTPAGAASWGRTVDSSPGRESSYRVCKSMVTYRAGASVAIDCKVSNDYGHVWYKTSDGYYIHSKHFATNVKRQTGWCQSD